jgi:hypothetical protein
MRSTVWCFPVVDAQAGDAGELVHVVGSRGRVIEVSEDVVLDGGS